MKNPKTYRRALPWVCLAALSLATACDSVSSSKRELYDGVPFKAKAKPVDKKTNPAMFQIEIKDPGRSLTGAREAADHAGTRYCIANYGTSTIDWAADPADPDAQLTLADGRALFQGTCNP